MTIIKKNSGETTAKAVFRAISSHSMAIILIVMVAGVSCMSDRFLTWDNMVNLFRQISVAGIVTVGLTFVMLADEIDLSGGSLAALSGVIACKLLTGVPVFSQNSAGSILGAILLTALIATTFGLITGIFNTYLKIPSFIATMGMQYVYMGIALLMTNAYPVIGMPDGFGYIGRGYIGPIPTPIVLMLIMFLIGWFTLKYTSFGRSFFAIGGNKEAAKLSGIPVKRNKVLMFGICGLAAGIAGVILASRMFSGQPTAASNVSLQAIAAVTIGGTSAAAGHGKMWGSLVGALIMGIISNALDLLQISPYFQFVILGSVLIFAVAMDRLKE